MPRVSVVLQNGVEIKVEGANDAQWTIEDNVIQGASRKTDTMYLTVYYKEPNKTEVRGRFLASSIVGYTIDPA